MSDTPIPSTEPSPKLPLGQRALVVARAEFAADVQADSPAFQSGPRVTVYFAPCVRGGKLLGLKVGNWCAASASFFVFTAIVQASEAGTDLAGEALAWASGKSESPVGYRAAVSELCADAIASHAWHDVHELGHRYPAVGDLLLFGRAGADPRTGGMGHVTIVEAVGSLNTAGTIVDGCDAGNSWVVLSGNGPNGKIARETRTASDKAEPMVGWISMDAAPATAS